MSSKESVEGDVRVALGDRLRSVWPDPLGYTLDDDSRDADTGDRDIGLHLQGTVQTDQPMPQITLVDVSETSQPAPYWGWAGDGSGPVQNMEGRIDARVFAGEPGEPPGGEAPALLAKQLGLAIVDVVRDAPGLADPGTTDDDRLVYDCWPNSGATVRQDREEPDSQIGDVEVGYGHFATSEYR